MDEMGLSKEKALEMAAAKAAQKFGFPTLGKIKNGYAASFVWIAKETQTIRNDELVSKCGWSPYDGMELPYIVCGTWKNGQLVFRNGKQ